VKRSWLFVKAVTSQNTTANIQSLVHYNVQTTLYRACFVTPTLIGRRDMICSNEKNVYTP